MTQNYSILLRYRASKYVLQPENLFFIEINLSTRKVNFTIFLRSEVFVNEACEN